MFKKFRFDRLPTRAPDETGGEGDGSAMWTGYGQGSATAASDENQGGDRSGASEAGAGQGGQQNGDQGAGEGEKNGESGEAGQVGEGAAPPESPDGYELKVPEGVELPDGVTFQFDENDPAAKIGRDVAHRMGLDQKGFEEQLLKPFVEARMQEHSQEVERQAAELEKLGENVGERIDSVANWLDQNLNEDQAQALRGAANTAAGVQALETLIRKANGQTSRVSTQGLAEGIKANSAPQEQDPAQVLFGATHGRK
jgi:hypothetical protein